jgi:probable selenium-dependent hydroxylase accessory protein YqeC
MEPDLLNGVPADFLESIDRSLCAVFLNEADGSARFSLKLPREGEPVPMMNAEYLVPVIGIDCLGKPAEPATLFRCEAMAEKFSVRRGEIMTPEFAARILMHPDGVCRHWKEGVVIIPFINKVDTPELDAVAKTLASLIMHNGNFPVKKVVFGSVRHSRVDSVSEE